MVQHFIRHDAAVTQLVESLLPKQEVVGSNPISRCFLLRNSKLHLGSAAVL